MKLIRSCLLLSILLVLLPTQVSADGWKWGSGYKGDAPPAIEVETDTLLFSGILSSSDIDVQKALDTLDDVALEDIPTAIVNHRVAFSDAGTLAGEARMTYDDATDTFEAWVIKTTALYISGWTTGMIPIMADSDKFDGDADFNYIVGTDTLSAPNITITGSLDTAITDTQVVYSNSGVLSGDAGMTYAAGTDALTIGGILVVDTTTLAVNTQGLGRVGIGLAAPSQPLDVLLGPNELALITGDDTEDLSYGLAIHAGTSAVDYAFSILSEGGTPYLHVSGLGLTGIGVADPDTRLEVFNGGTQLKLSYDATSFITFAVDAEGDLTIDSSDASYDLDFGDGNPTTTGTAFLGLIDLGTNTIDDTSMTGDWAFNSGNLSGIGTIGSGAITTSGDLTLDDGTTNSPSIIFIDDDDTEASIEYVDLGDILEITTTRFDVISDDYKFGTGDTDLIIFNYDCSTHDGISYWIGDGGTSGYFQYNNDLMLISAGVQLFLQNTDNYINSGDVGHIDLTAVTSIDLNAPAVITTGTGQFTGLGVNTAPDADQRIKVVAKATDGIVINIDGSTNDFTGTGNNFQRALFFSRDLNAGDGNEPDNLYTFSTQLNTKHTDAVLDNNNKNYILYESTLTDTATWSNDSADDRYVFDYASYALLNIDGSYGSTGAGFINLTNRGYRAKIDVDNTFTATGGATNQLVSYGFYGDMNIAPTLGSGALTVTSYVHYIDLVGTATGTSSNYGIFFNRVTGADSNYDMRTNTSEDWWWDGDYQKLIIGEGLDSHLQFIGSALEIKGNKVTPTDQVNLIGGHFNYQVPANTDVQIDFEGTTNSGQVKWMEGEDYFQFADKILLDDALYFTQADGNEYIDSLNDGYMDYGATTGHRFDSDIFLLADNRLIAMGADGVADSYITFGGTDIEMLSAGGLDIDVTTNVDINLSLAVGADLGVTGTSTLGAGANYVEIDGDGDQTFAGTAGFYPRRLSQNAEPANGTGNDQIDVGEFLIWHDADGGEYWLMYNDTTGGVRGIKI